jgi:hypothetical protein
VTLGFSDFSNFSLDTIFSGDSSFILGIDFSFLEIFSTLVSFIGSSSSISLRSLFFGTTYSFFGY